MMKAIWKGKVIAESDDTIYVEGKPGPNRDFNDKIDVPILVPQPGIPAVTQGHLPGRKSDVLRALGLSQVS